MLIDNAGLKTYLSAHLEEPIRTHHHTPARTTKRPREGKVPAIARLWHNFCHDVGDRFPPGTMWGNSKQFLEVCEQKGWKIIRIEAHSYNVESMLLREIAQGLQKEFPQANVNTRIQEPQSSHYVNLAHLEQRLSSDLATGRVPEVVQAVPVYHESLELQRFGVRGNSPKGTTTVYMAAGYSAIQDVLFIKVLDVINESLTHYWED